MIESTSIRRTGFSRPRIEGPTWLVLGGCYVLWASSLWATSWLGVLGVIPLAIAIALHSSLQHEVLHGHPTRSAVLNESLVFVPLGLFIPYRRFRDLHLKHHNDSRLTDPYDDPESYYLVGCEAQAKGAVTHAILAFNATFAGRMLIGPAMAMYAFWRIEIVQMRTGNRHVIDAWLRHVVGLALLLVLLSLTRINPFLYILASYVGMSLIMVRSFIEHRAVEVQSERTAIVDAHWFWRLLFLNNNYHLLHHEHPSLSWYLLPAKRKEAGAEAGRRNGGYVLPGYGHVAWRWLFRRREPYIHPLHDEPSQSRLRE